MKEVEPTNCSVCKEPNCNDWMYHSNLVDADNAICGKCKMDLGEKIRDRMIENLRNSFKKL